MQIPRRTGAAAGEAAPEQEPGPAATPAAAAASGPAALLARLRAAQEGIDGETRMRRLLVGLLVPELVLALVLLFSGAYLALVVAVLAVGLQVGAALLLAPDEPSVAEPAAVDPALDGVIEAQRTELVALRSEAARASYAVDLQMELSRRQQALLMRQLGRIDELEAREADPAALGELFALDHLATRMRRCAEGILVLSGDEPAPVDAPPVPASEVLRGAVAEIEDFNRVDVTVDRDVTLLGSAAVDLVHLIAELVENATVFSSPATRVRVHGQVFSGGYVVTVADEGVGIDPERAAALTALLADPEQPVPAGQLGYPVVARLARRHGIAVLLRDAEGGGSDIAVSMPASLVVGEARPVRTARGSHARTAAAAPAAASVAGPVARFEAAWPGHEVPAESAGLLPYVPDAAPDDAPSAASWLAELTPATETAAVADVAAEPAAIPMPAYDLVPEADPTPTFEAAPTFESAPEAVPAFAPLAAEVAPFAEPDAVPADEPTPEPVAVAPADDLLPAAWDLEPVSVEPTWSEAVVPEPLPADPALAVAPPFVEPAWTEPTPDPAFAPTPEPVAVDPAAAATYAPTPEPVLTSAYAPTPEQTPEPVAELLPVEQPAAPPVAADEAPPLAWQAPVVPAQGPAAVGPRAETPSAPFVAPAALVPEQPGSDRLDPPLTGAGLRRRRPQSHMAPQMQVAETTLPGEVAAGPAPDRSRQLLSAYRDGLVLGRSGLADAPTSPDPDDTRGEQS